MKLFGLLAATFVMAAGSAFAGTVCPDSMAFTHHPDQAGTGCNVLITINANGSVQVTIPDASPYEGSEDTIVGVVNNSASPVSSLHLTGTGISDFEGDGICSIFFVCTGWVSTATGYEGPTTTFSAISACATDTTPNCSVTANFTPGVAAAGGTTYFSLEAIPDAGLAVSVNGLPGVPVPPSIMLTIVGLLMGGTYFAARKYVPSFRA